MRKKIIFAVVVTLLFSSGVEAARRACDSVDIKIFGFRLLRVYHGDCSNRHLPDGHWDWFY